MKRSVLKRLLAVSLSAVLSIAAVGCGDKAAEAPAEEASVQEEAPTDETVQEPEQEAEKEALKVIEKAVKG